MCIKSSFITDDFWEYRIDIVWGAGIFDYLEGKDMCGDVNDYLLSEDWGDSVYGRSVVLPDGSMFIWLSDDAGMGTVAHEAFHSARHILHNVQGIPLTDDTEEVYARLVGSIVNKIARI